jgi:hypothetical protein
MEESSESVTSGPGRAGKTARGLADPQLTVIKRSLDDGRDISCVARGVPDLGPGVPLRSIIRWSLTWATGRRDRWALLQTRRARRSTFGGASGYGQVLWAASQAGWLQIYGEPAAESVSVGPRAITSLLMRRGGCEPPMSYLRRSTVFRFRDTGRWREPRPVGAETDHHRRAKQRPMILRRFLVCADPRVRPLSRRARKPGPGNPKIPPNRREP